MHIRRGLPELRARLDICALYFLIMRGTSWLCAVPPHKFAGMKLKIG